MRILVGHTHVGPDYGISGFERWASRLRAFGFHVEVFPLVLGVNRPVVYFDELNILWRFKDLTLMKLYEKLQRKLSNFDVFVCYNGANIHPDFVQTLEQVTVYGCFDDPESSDKLSRPVVKAFDIAMVGNIAAVDTYKAWGVENVHWWPLGYRVEDYDSTLTESDILSCQRDESVVLLCERVEKYRKARVDAYAKSFPHGKYYGRGWPAGFLPESERIPLLQRSKIGVNIHNSTGPINVRTFCLPANGVMQICDNRDSLSKIYRLDEEVVGFDCIEEAIELTRYYLENEDERRSIAARGWRRATTDYNEVACFRRLTDAVESFLGDVNSKHTKILLDFDPSPSTKLLATKRKKLAIFSTKVRNKILGN
jgi:spore maturation protein CgeB